MATQFLPKLYESVGDDPLRPAINCLYINKEHTVCIYNAYTLVVHKTNELFPDFDFYLNLPEKGILIDRQYVELMCKQKNVTKVSLEENRIIIQSKTQVLIPFEENGVNNVFPDYTIVTPKERMDVPAIGINPVYAGKVHAAMGANFYRYEFAGNDRGICVYPLRENLYPSVFGLLMPLALDIDFVERNFTKGKEYYSSKIERIIGELRLTHNVKFASTLNKDEKMYFKYRLIVSVILQCDENGVMTKGYEVFRFYSRDEEMPYMCVSNELDKYLEEKDFKFNVDRKDFYPKDINRYRTRKRLVTMAKLGMDEVGVAEFGIPGIHSGLYIETVWNSTDDEFNEYIDFVKKLIDEKGKNPENN